MKTTSLTKVPPENHTKAKDIMIGDLLWLPSVYNSDTKGGVTKVKPGKVTEVLWNKNEGWITIKYVPDCKRTQPMISVNLPTQSIWEFLIPDLPEPEPPYEDVGGRADWLHRRMEERRKW